MQAILRQCKITISIHATSAEEFYTEDIFFRVSQ